MVDLESKGMVGFRSIYISPEFSVSSFAKKTKIAVSDQQSGAQPFSGRLVSDKRK